MISVQLQGDPISCGDTSGLEVLPGIRVDGIPVALITSLSTGSCGQPATSANPTAGSQVLRVNGVPVVIAGTIYLPQPAHAVRVALAPSTTLRVQS